MVKITNKCVKCMKKLFWLLIAICFLFGVIIEIAIDASRATSAGGYKELAIVTYLVVTLIYIVTFFAVFFTLCSYCIYVSSWPKFKYVFSCIFGILACSHFVLSLILITDDTEEFAADYYNEDDIQVFKQYYVNEEIKETIDRIQKTYLCCGGFSKDEYGEKMPLTCCRQSRNIDRDCSKHRAYNRTCIEALKHSYVRVMEFINIFTFLEAFIEFLLALNICFLYIACKNVQNRPNVNEESSDEDNEEDVPEKGESSKKKDGYEPDDEDGSCSSDCEM